MTWSSGFKSARSLWLDGVCVGFVDTPELAAEIVAAMNTVGAATREAEALAAEDRNYFACHFCSGLAAHTADCQRPNRDSL